MADAPLNAAIDVQLRNLVQHHGTYKQDSCNIDRAFGGLNVLFVGDFLQLDPPTKSIPVHKIPNDIKAMATGKVPPAPASTAIHGQQLWWGGPEVGVQGVTELTTQWRCKDAWLLEVQEEFRHGALSEDNYNFIHGLETTVPGSWTGDAVECGNPACQRLKQVWSENRRMPWEERRGMECTACAKQRESRQLVATSANDKRFQKEEFRDAIAIVANNDVK